MQIEKIQKELNNEGIAGWLLTDFQRTNMPAVAFLELDIALHASRRWFYFIPAAGEPVKLVHGVEAVTLDRLPGRKVVYHGRVQMIALLGELLPAGSVLAMEYSPEALLPAVSRVDAGTVELIRNMDIKVTSSADLLQRLTARWGETGREQHFLAAANLKTITENAWELIRNRMGSGDLTEFEVSQFMMSQIEKMGMITDHPPICAVDAHAADPHYSATTESTAVLGPEQVVLIDIWAKIQAPEAVYADITWMAFTGHQPGEKLLKVFDVVINGRDMAAQAVSRAFRDRRPITGAQVDEVCRGAIDKAGFAPYFIHRTGHSLGKSAHGPGANIDSLESYDYRQLIPDTGFTIEPGVYLPGEFGVRSEINIALLPDFSVQISGTPIQKELVLITP